jgi:glyoxylase-like metal-dependent hydrolase (beta-lactamase superfamily II)
VFAIDRYEGNNTFRMDTAVLLDDHDQILIDAGTPDILPLIEAAFKEAGLKIEDLTGIVITHQDQDHIGTLAAIKRRAPRARIYASALQAPGISGKEKPIRLILEEAQYETLPPAEKAKTPLPASLWPKVEYAEIDRILHDRDQFPWCGGTEILFTEGHIPGHLSLYLRETKTFITGDALVIRDGRPALPEKFTLDLELAKKDLRDIGNKYEIKDILCYHGGFWRGDGSALLKNLKLHTRAGDG